MIVLDEQLLGRNIEYTIAQWYRGSVQWITDIRPHTVIKDNAIPHLLRALDQPTFVTIVEHHSGENEYSEVAIQLARVRDVLERWRLAETKEKTS